MNAADGGGIFGQLVALGQQSLVNDEGMAVPIEIALAAKTPPSPARKRTPFTTARAESTSIMRPRSTHITIMLR